MSCLELRRDSGGWRHYLDGAPVHCGEAIEMLWEGVWVPVRYEARLIQPVRVTLYGVPLATIGEEELALHRFRWIEHPDNRLAGAGWQQ